MTVSNKRALDIFNDMQLDIIRGVYPPRSKLPPERELAEKYKTSRFAIREAMAMLAQMGYVETVPQSGTLVRDFMTEGTLDVLVQVMKIRGALDPALTQSLLRYRYTLETQAAGDAAANLSPEDLLALRALIETKARSLGDVALQSQCDYDIHFRLVSASRNLISIIIFRSFVPVYKTMTDLFYSLPGAPERSLALNKKLLRALEKRDAEGARKAMGDILLYAEKRVMERMMAG